MASTMFLFKNQPTSPDWRQCSIFIYFLPMEKY